MPGLNVVLRTGSPNSSILVKFDDVRTGFCVKYGDVSITTWKGYGTGPGKTIYLTKQIYR